MVALKPKGELVIEIIQSVIRYVYALILSTAKRKTCSAVMDITSLRSDRMLSIIEEEAPTPEILLKLAQKYLNPNFRWYVVVDDTLINKRFSKIIEGAGINYDSATGTHYISLCSVVIMVTDGNIAIPIDQCFWIEKALAGNEYKSKIELAKELILRVTESLKIRYILADGHYASANFLEWANQHNFKINMRFHSNRKIQIANQHEKIQVKKYFEDCRKSKKFIRATWQGLELYICMIKYRNKCGNEKTVYLVSNYNAGSVTAHSRAYKLRWVIEKFFRTAKQFLGMTDCQSRKKVIQDGHLKCVFVAYAILQIMCKLKRMKNPEAVIKYLLAQNRGVAISLIDRFNRNFGVICS